MRLILTDDLCNHIRYDCDKLNKPKPEGGVAMEVDGNGSWLGDCDAQTCGSVLPMCNAKAVYEQNLAVWKDQMKLAATKIKRAEETMKESNGYGFRYVGVVRPGIKLPKCGSSV